MWRPAWPTKPFCGADRSIGQDPSPTVRLRVIRRLRPRLSAGENAAIEVDIAAGHVAGFLTGEEDRRIRDFLGPAEPPQPNRPSGIPASTPAIAASRAFPVPNMASHIGVMIAAGRIALQRIG